MIEKFRVKSTRKDIFKSVQRGWDFQSQNTNCWFSSKVCDRVVSETGNLANNQTINASTMRPGPNHHGWFVKIKL